MRHWPSQGPGGGQSKRTPSGTSRTWTRSATSSRPRPFAIFQEDENGKHTPEPGLEKVLPQRHSLGMGRPRTMLWKTSRPGPGKWQQTASCNFSELVVGGHYVDDSKCLAYARQPRPTGVTVSPVQKPRHAISQALQRPGQDDWPANVVPYTSRIWSSGTLGNAAPVRQVT